MQVAPVADKTVRAPEQRRYFTSPPLQGAAGDGGYGLLEGGSAGSRKTGVAEPCAGGLEIQVPAGYGDLELDLVVQVLVFGQHGELAVDQAPGQAFVQPGGQEGVEAEAHVDVGPAAEGRKQGAVNHAVSHGRPRLRPDALGDQVPVKRQRQGPGRGSDHFRRVPVGHLAEDGCVSGQAFFRDHAPGDVGANAVDGLIQDRGWNFMPSFARRQRTDLEDVDFVLAVDAELDVQFPAAGDVLDLDHGIDQAAEAWRPHGVEARTVNEDGLAFGAAGDGVGAAADVVVIDHEVRAAGVQVAGQHDARYDHVSDHWLD